MASTSRQQHGANSLVNALIETNCSGYQKVEAIELNVPSLSVASRTTKFATNGMNNIFESSRTPADSRTSAKTSVAASSDPTSIFQRRLVKDSGFINFKANGSVIKWCIANDFSTLLITPLSAPSSCQYSNIKINFADKLKNKCYTFAIDDISNQLIIDLVSESGILITLKFNIFTDFSLPMNTTLQLINNWCYVSEPYDFNIRVPNFMKSINSKEFLILLKDGGIIKCSRINFNDDIIVSLFNDSSYFSSTFGRLGKFLPLGNRSISMVSDDADAVSKYQIPKGCSLKTIIDCFIVNEKFLITITLNKKLVIWDILTGTMISETKVEQFLQDSQLNDNLINNSGEPMCLLRLFNEEEPNSICDNTFDFVCYLPVGMGQFKIWSLNVINADKIELINLGPQFEYLPILPDDNSIWLVQEFQLYNKCFLNVDQRLYNNTKNSEIKYNLLVLMNSNSSTEFQLLTIFTNGDHQWVKSRLNKQLFSENHPDNSPSSTNPESLSEFYSDKLLQNDKFSPSVIEACCSLFEKKLNMNEDIFLAELSTNEKIIKIINQLSLNSNSTMLSSWQTLEAALMEFSKLADESLCVNYNNVSGEILISKAHGGISRLRLTEAIESLYLNKSKLVSSLPLLSTSGTLEHKFKDSCGLVNDATMLRLIKVLTDFKYSLPSVVLSDFKTKLLCQFETNNKDDVFNSLELIFNESLEGKIPENALQKLMDELNSLPDAFKIFGYILEYYKIESFEDLLIVDSGVLDDQKVLDLLDSYKLNMSFDLIYLMESLKQVSTILEDLVYDLSLVTLILTPNDKTSEFILSESLNLYKRFHLFKMSCSVKVSAQLEGEVINGKEGCSLYDSLFLRIIVKYFPSDWQQFSINKLLNFTCSDFFHLGVLNELSITNNSEMILNKAFDYQSPFASPEPLLQLFKDLSYLNSGFDEKAVGMIIKSAENIVAYEPTDFELYFSTAVTEFSTEGSLSAFYSKMSLVYKELSHLSGALQFIKLAIEQFNKTELSDKKLSALNKYDLKKHYYSIYYDISLSLKDFDEAFDVLVELQENPKFEKAMIAQPRYSLLTRFIEQIINSEDLKKLNNYRFSPADIFKIDEILFRIADSIAFNFSKTSTLLYVSSCMNQALQFFKILYSWRLTHGNIKGACEALYQYVCKYQYFIIEKCKNKNSETIDFLNDIKFKPLFEKQSLEIKQLYLIILNSLKILNGDKWLLKENFEYSTEKNLNSNYPIKNKFEVVYINDISRELDNMF